MQACRLRRIDVCQSAPPMPQTWSGSIRRPTFWAAAGHSDAKTRYGAGGPAAAPKVRHAGRHSYALLLWLRRQRALKVLPPPQTKCRERAVPNSNILTDQHQAIQETNKEHTQRWQAFRKPNSISTTTRQCEPTQLHTRPKLPRRPGRQTLWRETAAAQACLTYRMSGKHR